MISPDTIERIRERTSLSSIVGQAVKLERRGRSFVGLCPFHKEKSPSFHVNDERGYYHCFGCHAAGDVFKFVQETEGLSFHEAIRSLGEKAGVEVTDDLTDAERKQRIQAKKREDAFYEVNQLAASFFEKMLRTHPDADVAHRELIKRELPYDGPAHQVLASFRVGFAPESWDALANHLRDQGADPRSAEAVGLLAPRKSGGGYYDRFRGRLMFAVIDIHGRVVAFSGRALPSKEPLAPGAEAPAKYINSPESPIYKKRDTVFGLYQARTALREGKPAVLVEGNFDVVSLHARGIQAAVAPLGTAFTVEQGRMIRRFSGNVTFLFDGDSAGRKAVRSSRDACRQSGLSAKVASLPEGIDPDDFSRQKGKTGLDNLLAAARGMLDHLIAEVLDEKFVSGDAQARANRIEEVLSLLATEEDPTVRALAEQYADHLASTLGSRLGVADARTFRALEAGVRRALTSKGTTPVPQEKNGAPRVAPNRAQSREQLDEIGQAIIGALLDYPELMDSEELLTYGTTMQGDLAVAVVSLKRSLASTPKGPDGTTPVARALTLALAKMPETIRPFAAERVAAPVHQDIEHAKTELFGNLEKLKRLEFARLGASTRSDLEKARSQGDYDEELSLLRAQQERARERRGMKKG